MPALWLWFNLLPPVIRRLMGAVLLLGIAAGAIAFAVHRYGNGREAAGYTKGWNHAVVLAAKRQERVRDSLERRADSLAAQAARHDTVRVTVIPPSPHPRIAPLTAADSELVPTVPLSNLVRIYVASDSTNTPHYADAYIGKLVVWYDSVVYHQLLPQRDSAIVLAVAWKRAWGSEHEARLAADSLAALRVVAMPEKPNMHRIAYLAFGVVAGAVLHNQFRHR